MKKFKLASVFILSILFSTFYSCDNEPLDSGLIQDVNNPFTNNLVGTWTLVDFNTTVTSTSVFGGMTIESSSIVNGNNPDYDLTFTASTFSSTGGYGYSVTTTVNGQTISQDLSLENVSGLGNYTTNGSEMTTDGSFFTLEFQGMDLSELQGEQTVPYTISADGQTLTFNQDSTETNNSNGAVITSVITGTSVWSKIANTNQTCADATAFAAAAENAYNNDNNNENLCNAYRSALQNKITACGDSTGEIQAVIDSLGNCTTTTDASIIGTWRIISLTSNGIEELQEELDYSNICYWEETYEDLIATSIEYSGTNCTTEGGIETFDYAIINNIITFVNGDDPLEIIELTDTTLKYQDVYEEVGIEYVDVYTYSKQ